MSVSHQLSVVELVSVRNKRCVLTDSCGGPVITSDHSMLPQHNDCAISTVHVASKYNFMLQTLTWNMDQMVLEILQF